MQLGTNPIFPTNLIEYARPEEYDFTPGLVEYLYKERDAQVWEPALYSLKGNNAWHSNDNLADFPTEWSVKLRKMILDVSAVYHGAVTGGMAMDPELIRIKCWSIILGQYATSNFHSHPNSDVSGVYWVQNPDEIGDDEGRFVVPDPRGGAFASRLEGSHQFFMPPKVGSGLVFGSWLPHYVEPHYKEGDRISISWNVFLKDPPEGYQGTQVSMSSWRDQHGDNWG